MFKDITLGQYISGNSILHRTDSRIKIILTLVFIIVLFLISNPVMYAVFSLFVVFLMLISKISVKYILKGIKPMLFIIIFTVILNLFLTPGDAVFSKELFGKFTISITDKGILASVMLFMRLTLLIILTSLLTLTTSPLMLTDGIESLLKPFNVIKVPSHEIAMMMSIAIRFIPTLAEETDKIIKAQTARGADFESSNIFIRAKSMIPILVPLFISAFRRADELATAMDSRCYKGGKNRTRMKQMKITKSDFLVVIISILVAVSILILNFFVF